MVVEFDNTIDRINCGIKNGKIHFLLIEVDKKTGGYIIRREQLVDKYEPINFVRKQIDCPYSRDGKCHAPNKPKE